jgi:hypothetical protein
MLTNVNVNVDLETAYVTWFDASIATLVGGPDQLEALITQNYRRELKEYLIAKKAEGEASLKEARDKLDEECKNDVGSQALRVTISTALAPFNIIDGNLKAAGDKPGVIAQIIRVTIGASLKDIEENGILGDDNSEARKAVEAGGDAVEWLGDRLGIHW